MNELLPTATPGRSQRPTATASKSRSKFLLGLALGCIATLSYQNVFRSQASRTTYAASLLSTSGSFSYPSQIVSISDEEAQKETFHVIFGMMGTNKALYDAWEVALKSVLVHAPTDADLKVHMLCNKDAHQMVKEKIDAAQLVGSRWRNSITLASYNVEAFNDPWRKFLHTTLKSDKIDERVSLGGYYRLLAHDILGELDVGPALYMDTDIVIISNLNDLMRSMNETKLFQGSANWFCSGFIVVNVKRFGEFWEKVGQLESDPMPIGDQDIMAHVLKQFPEVYEGLPKEWDRNLGNGWRRTPHKLFDEKEAAGMLHFQGGSGRSPTENYFTNGFTQYCSRTPGCRGNADRLEMMEKTWGLAEYYVKLTWKWAMYYGRSSIPPNQEGCELNFTSFTAKLPETNNGTVLVAEL